MCLDIKEQFINRPIINLKRKASVLNREVQFFVIVQIVR